VDRSEILLVDVPLHPERRDVAGDERRRGAGLNVLAGEDHLLDDGPGDRGAHGQLRTNPRVLLLGFGDVPRRHAEDSERLQRRLDVSRRVVVVRLRRLEIPLRDGFVLKQILVAIEVALRQVETVLRLAVRGDGIVDVGTAHVEQHVSFLHLRAGVHDDPGNRSTDLRNRLGRTVIVPVHRAGRAQDGHPRRLRHRDQLQVGQLLRRHREVGRRGCGGRRGRSGGLW
jgi:hypothetical protein